MEQDVSTPVLDESPIVSEVTPQPNPEVAAEPTTRQVVLTIPVAMGDEAVQLFMSVGTMVMESLSAGRMIILFPSAAKNEAGQVQAQIGRADVLLAAQKDVQVMINLGNAINAANTKMINAKSLSPSDQLTKTITANKNKANAVLNATSAVNGTGAIIVP